MKKGQEQVETVLEKGTILWRTPRLTTCRALKKCRLIVSQEKGKDEIEFLLFFDAASCGRLEATIEMTEEGMLIKLPKNLELPPEKREGYVKETNLTNAFIFCFPPPKSLKK